MRGRRHRNSIFLLYFAPSEDPITSSGFLIDGGIFHCHTSCNHRMPAECELIQIQQTEIKWKVKKYLGSLIYILSLFVVRIDVDIRGGALNAPDCAELV